MRHTNSALASGGMDHCLGLRCGLSSFFGESSSPSGRRHLPRPQAPPVCRPEAANSSEPFLLGARSRPARSSALPALRRAWRWYSRLGGRRLRAAWRPSSKYCYCAPCRRGRLARLYRLCEMASSTQPGPFGLSSAFSRIRAWVSLRAGEVPATMRHFRSSRSSSLNMAGYFFFIMG